MDVNTLKVSNKVKLLQILEHDEVFIGFSAKAQSMMLEHAKFIRYFPAQCILAQHECLDDLYILLSGTLQIGWLQNNGELIVNDYIQHASAFNLVSLLQRKPLNYDYFSVNQVEVAVVPGDIFFQLLAVEASAMWQLLQLLSKRMYDLFEQNRYLRTANLTQRIARHLLKLYALHAERKAALNSNHFKMSQQEFAELFNVSRQTLNKHLQVFLQENIIEWNYSQVRILNLQRLKEMSILSI